MSSEPHTEDRGSTVATAAAEALAERGSVEALAAVLRGADELLVPVQLAIEAGDDSGLDRTGLEVSLAPAAGTNWLFVATSQAEFAELQDHSDPLLLVSLTGTELLDEALPRLPGETGLLLDPATTALALPPALLPLSAHDPESAS